MSNELAKKLVELGLDLSVAWNTDKPVRNGPQWFIGKSFDLNGLTVQQAWFGDYSKDVKGNWETKYEGLGGEATAKAATHVREALAEAKAAREQFWTETAPILEKEFDEFSDRAPLPPYVVRKQLDSLFGARVMPNEQGDPILVVPMRDVDGKFWNYQRIYSQKMSKGDKFFKKGARIDGTFFAFKNVDDTTEVIYLAEGFATAASVFMALDKTQVVLAAFNAGNLFHVASAVHDKWPRLRVVVCADNDVYTMINGKPYNVGKEKGRRAAGVCGGSMKYPTFKHPAKGLTDFNDLHCAQGLAEVKQQILFAKVTSALEPMQLSTGKAGAYKPPSEKQLADYILDFFKDSIVRQDKSLFLYGGTHWRELDSVGIDRIHQMMFTVCSNTLKNSEIDQAYKVFFKHCPVVPAGVDLFQPNPFTANFSDGTLHIEPAQGKYELKFRPHAREDYLTSVLPFAYPKESSPAPKLMKMLEDLWSTNPDKEEIKKLVQQIMGATLCPAFPIIALFTGKPNSGKSTIIKLLVHMMNPENVCSVQLCDMQGFNMETMVGRLLNFDTDIDTQRPMNDSEVKKIIDRVPRRVRRKGRTDIYSFVPAVHLFASNGLPRSLDGSSHAYGRRFVVIGTDSFEGSRDAVADFEKVVWADEPRGVLSFALAGLQSLCEAGGKFTVPQSSFDLVSEFENESDLIGQFLDEVKHGEVFEGQTKLVFSNESRIERSKLWEVFSRWQAETVGKLGATLSKVMAYRLLAKRGLVVKTVMGTRYFYGLGPRVEGDPIG